MRLSLTRKEVSDILVYHLVAKGLVPDRVVTDFIMKKLETEEGGSYLGKETEDDEQENDWDNWLAFTIEWTEKVDEPEEGEEDVAYQRTSTGDLVPVL